MTEHLPLIVIEVVLVFGGALAFAWWQFRDLDREKRKREQRAQGQSVGQVNPSVVAPDRESGG